MVSDKAEGRYLCCQKKSVFFSDVANAWKKLFPKDPVTETVSGKRVRVETFDNSKFVKFIGHDLHSIEDTLKYIEPEFVKHKFLKRNWSNKIIDCQIFKVDVKNVSLCIILTGKFFFVLGKFSTVLTVKFINQ